jgi:hypothetical protein
MKMRSLLCPIFMPRGVSKTHAAYPKLDIENSLYLWVSLTMLPCVF